MAKDTHVTKDGRVAKKGLYYYMNQRKKKGKKKVDAKKNPGLAKLPKKVRNKMGFMKRGGKVNG